MTIRDIQAHLERTLGTQLSHETISNITDAVAEEVKAWQSRPLEPIDPGRTGYRSRARARARTRRSVRSERNNRAGSVLHFFEQPERLRLA